LTLIHNVGILNTDCQKGDKVSTSNESKETFLVLALYIGLLVVATVISFTIGCVAVFAVMGVCIGVWNALTLQILNIPLGLFGLFGLLLSTAGLLLSDDPFGVRESEERAGL
jgi:hypothetical protein